MIRATSFLQVLTPVLPTIPGHPLIISTWVITRTPGMDFLMVMVATADTLSVLVMATHLGITPIVIMVTIHHGTPRIITAPIILAGNLIMVTAHVTMVVATGITTAAVVGEMIAMREMTMIMAAAGIENVWMVMRHPPTTVTGKPVLAITADHVSAVMFQPHLPDIPGTRAW